MAQRASAQASVCLWCWWEWKGVSGGGACAVDCRGWPSVSLMTMWLPVSAASMPRQRARCEGERSQPLAMASHFFRAASQWCF